MTKQDTINTIWGLSILFMVGCYMYAIFAPSIMAAIAGTFFFIVCIVIALREYKASDEFLKDQKNRMNL